MSGLAIRRGGAADWEAAARIHAASWRSAYRGIYPDAYLDRDVNEERRAHWRAAAAEMEGEANALFLAEVEGEAVGFACVRRFAEAAGPLLDNLHVLPDRKEQGVGRRLMMAAASWLAERDAEARLQLVVWEGNAPARRFYARIGGREVEAFDAPLPGGGSARQVRVVWERAAALAAGIREAREPDIPRLIEIRAAVRENRLSDPASIGPDQYRPYIAGALCWVAEEEGRIAGFAALDAERCSVWALFVAPEAEGLGHGRRLLEHLTAGARRRGLAELRLSTADGSGAERLYRQAGWTEAGRAEGEVLMRLPLRVHAAASRGQ